MTRTRTVIRAMAGSMGWRAAGSGASGGMLRDRVRPAGRAAGRPGPAPWPAAGAGCSRARSLVGPHVGGGDRGHAALVEGQAAPAGSDGDLPASGPQRDRRRPRPSRSELPSSDPNDSWFIHGLPPVGPAGTPHGIPLCRPERWLDRVPLCRRGPSPNVAFGGGHGRTYTGRSRMRRPESAQKTVRSVCSALSGSELRGREQETWRWCRLPVTPVRSGPGTRAPRSRRAPWDRGSRRPASTTPRRCPPASRWSRPAPPEGR